MVFTTLRIACPGRNCSSKYLTNVTWSHYKCGGVIEIDDYADLQCRRCGKCSNVFKWGFDCGNHPADDRFQLPTIDTMSSVIAMATELTSAMGLQWYRRLLQNIINSSS